MPIAGKSRALSPAGYFVTITTYRDKPPATERSMPPCMTTSAWPSDAIARADANGSIVRSTPLLRLDDANTRLAAMTPRVATSTVTRPRESKRLDPRGTASSTSSRPVVCVTGTT